MEMGKNLIKFTENAKIQFEEVKSHLEVPEPFALQVIVEDYKAGKVEFSFNFKPAASTDEFNMSHKGFSYIVDSMSAFYLAGSTFDYINGSFELILDPSVDFHIVGEA